jgi:hypothetical protein
MPYTSADGRIQLLDSLARAAEDLAIALTALTEAYEHVDENTGDVLERELFRPIQLAYGRAKRGYSEFAARYDLPDRDFEPPVAGAPSHGVKGFLEGALDAVQRADGTLATLQDSMLPIEVGDPELRSDLEHVRELLGHYRARTREIERTLGR